MAPGKRARRDTGEEEVIAIDGISSNLRHESVSTHVHLLSEMSIWQVLLSLPSCPNQFAEKESAPVGVSTGILKAESQSSRLIIPDL
jgi:hypothetical protein